MKVEISRCQNAQMNREHQQQPYGNKLIFKKIVIPRTAYGVSDSINRLGDLDLWPFDL